MSQAKPHGISIPNDLLDKGKKHARRQGRSFSGHVCWLLRRDLELEPQIHGDEQTRQGDRQRGGKPSE